MFDQEGKWYIFCKGTAYWLFLEWHTYLWSTYCKNVSKIISVEGQGLSLSYGYNHLL